MSKRVKFYFLVATIQCFIAIAMSFSPQGAGNQILTAAIFLSVAIMAYFTEIFTALTTRLAALEVELKELKSKQPGAIGQ